ncbi:hypothetical protein RHMOL_Rhmol11G0203300 [Rhododendron molle]|uniref:Uncharacterized protein n=1 Tax=Rhododendron molle TaxID=49168 RepID=A0ACC0LW02_RHOML|nr:hypothetical protein RHMOL_Rhmol11G0203300 [Rhododendron molle]
MQLFLPILLPTCEHWFCVVINLVEKRIDVLDSMKLKSDEKTQAIAEVVSALVTILKRTRPMEYTWKNWIIHHPDVPQQNNTLVLTPSPFVCSVCMIKNWTHLCGCRFDCGFYTIRFMEHWTGGRMNTRELEANMGVDMRKRLLVRFVLSPHNNSRNEVLEKCSAEKISRVQRRASGAEKKRK